MRVALTGATGFVGSHLADALRKRGDDLVCLVRTAAEEATLHAQGTRSVGGDLDDDDALRALTQDADVVYHVAGLIAARSRDEFFRVNRDGTARVTRAARAAGVRRLVYVSSLAVTGPTVPGRPLDESGPPRPVTDYGHSKLAGEDAVRSAGIPFTIVRPPIVYGPRDRQLLRLFRMARLRFVPMMGEGRQELSLVHARDLAHAVIAAGTSDATAGGTYHAADDTPVTQRALMRAIGTAIGARVRTIPLPPAILRGALHLTGALARLKDRATLLDPAKVAELLAPAFTCSSAALARDAGWRAAIPLEDGLAETARWYRDQGWL